MTIVLKTGNFEIGIICLILLWGQSYAAKIDQMYYLFIYFT